MGDDHEPNRFLIRLVGPGKLGANLGLLLAVGAILLSSAFRPVSQLTLPQLMFGVFAGYFGGAVGGLTGRDEFLREDWADHRLLVGSVSGLLAGTAIAFMTADAWIVLGGALGGGIGGLVDCWWHIETLEEGD